MGMLGSALHAEPERLEDTVAFVFGSKSRPGKKHITVLRPLTEGEDLQVVCSCEGFENFQYCWHQNWVLSNV